MSELEDLKELERMFTDHLIFHKELEERVKLLEEKLDRHLRFHLEIEEKKMKMVEEWEAQRGKGYIIQD